MIRSPRERVPVRKILSLSLQPKEAAPTDAKLAPWHASSAALPRRQRGRLQSESEPVACNISREGRASATLDPLVARALLRSVRRCGDIEPREQRPKVGAHPGALVRREIGPARGEMGAHLVCLCVANAGDAREYGAAARPAAHTEARTFKAVFHRCAANVGASERGVNGNASVTALVRQNETIIGSPPILNEQGQRTGMLRAPRPHAGN